MSTKTPATLEAKIERLVREHLVAQQLLVKAAVERAFAARTASPDVATQRRRTSVTTGVWARHFHRHHRDPEDHPVNSGQFSAQADSAPRPQG